MKRKHIGLKAALSENCAAFAAAKSCALKGPTRISGSSRRACMPTNSASWTMPPRPATRLRVKVQPLPASRARHRRAQAELVGQGSNGMGPWTEFRGQASVRRAPPRTGWDRALRQARIPTASRAQRPSGAAALEWRGQLPRWGTWPGASVTLTVGTRRFSRCEQQTAAIASRHRLTRLGSAPPRDLRSEQQPPSITASSTRRTQP